jgi:hypothetical protein
MKRVVIAVIVLAAILAAGIVESHYVNKTFDSLNVRLHEIDGALSDGDTARALTLSERTFDWWEEQRTWIEIIAFSSDIRAFSVGLGEQIGSLKADDLKNARSKCQSLLSMSDNMRQVLDFNLQDVL